MDFDTFWITVEFVAGQNDYILEWRWLQSRNQR